MLNRGSMSVPLTTAHVASSEQECCAMRGTETPVGRPRLGSSVIRVKAGVDFPSVKKVELR
jgi:hypothetical protein